MESIVWPAPKWPTWALQQSRDKIATEPEGSIWTALCRTRLAAAAGDLSRADVLLAEVLALLEDRRAGRDQIRQVVPLALLLGDQARASALLTRLWPDGAIAPRFALAAQDGDPSIVTLQLDGQGAIFVLDRAIFASDHGEVILLRLADTYPLLAHYLETHTHMDGQVVLNLGDAGHRPGLTFSDSRPGYFLIPDVCFMESGGYEQHRRLFDERPVAWENRKPVALWRGTTTGRQDGGWRRLPRIRLCEIGAAHRDMVDAGITNVVQIADIDEAQRWIAERRLSRPHLEPEHFQHYRYQIDIDGNSNSWPGLFLKLLTGSTVLKVASPTGLRQWYYDRLLPWVNFVPLDSDMADLPDKVCWLRANDNVARTIGEAGRTLAMSLSYEAEIGNASAIIEAARRSASAA